MPQLLFLIVFNVNLGAVALVSRSLELQVYKVASILFENVPSFELTPALAALDLDVLAGHLREKAVLAKRPVHRLNHVLHQFGHRRKDHALVRSEDAV